MEHRSRRSRCIGISFGRWRTQRNAVRRLSAFAIRFGRRSEGLWRGRSVVPVRLRIFDVVGRRPSEESFFCRGTVRLRSLRLSRSVKSRRPNVFSKRGVAVVRPRGGSACRAGPGGVACARVANASLSRAPSSGLPEHRIGRGIFVLCFFVYFCRNAVPALRTKQRRQTHASSLPSIGFRKNEFSL